VAYSWLSDALLIHVLQTVFARADGTETYYFNSQLFLKFMYVDLMGTIVILTFSDDSTNVRRSGVDILDLS